MAKLTWEIINHTQADLDITQYVRSVNYTVGRPSPLATYSGNIASLTITNSNNEVAYAAINDEIYFNAQGNSSNLSVFVGTVTSRNYQDEPGNGNNSTATILLNDVILQAGMANLVSQSLTDPTDQITEIGFVLQPQFNLASPYGNDVNMSVGTFTVNANQRVGEIIAGDRGIVHNFGIETEYIPPSEFTVELLDNGIPSIGRTTSATQIAYQSISRIEAASNSLFFTQATITGSAATETSNAENILTYGIRTFTATTAQSQLVGQTAQWYANAFSDPTAETLQISFTDVAQDFAALSDFLEHGLFATQFFEVSYTPPGGVSTTGYYWPEQITVNATTSQTTIDMVMTPQTYYANFILDDAIFGVLDTDRLGV